METNPNTVNTEFSAATAAQPAPRKKNGLVIFLLLLLLAIVGGGGYAYYLYQQKNDESAAYALLENDEVLANYEDFLQRFPNGAHAADVRKRFEALKKMYADWQSIEQSNYASNFERFIASYPKSTLVKVAEIKIDSLDWINAKMSNTLEAIEAYIAKHPEGRYLAEATQAQGTIKDTQISDSEKLQINMTLSGFFDALGNNDEAEICTFIAPKLTKFLTKSNATKADVVAMVNKMYGENIVGCSFVVNSDLRGKKYALGNGEMGYDIEVSVDQHIARTNAGKTFGSFVAKLTLDDQFTITSLVMDEVSRSESEESNVTAMEQIDHKINNFIKGN